MATLEATTFHDVSEIRVEYDDAGSTTKWLKLHIDDEHEITFFFSGDELKVRFDAGVPKAVLFGIIDSKQT